MDKVDGKVIASIRSREPIGEPFLRLSLILKTGGIETDGYLGMCGDRIADAELIDGEDVKIDFINFPDMELTAAGVRRCREILQNYVSEDIIADAHEALCKEKGIRASVNLISQTLRKMRLWGLVRAFIKSDAPIRRFVVTEICQRFILAKCFRKIRSTYYNILVRIKYHDLLSIYSRAAASMQNSCK
ncbi:MAG: hypothetical protein K2N43_02335 [Lachnospiraceae bacterium]|nr:hypothetical protein [Lachnospiraceae bacterium]